MRDMISRTIDDDEPQDLRESERRYRSLFENSNDAILFGVPDSGVILAANYAACAMFGMSRAELLSKRRLELIDPGDHRHVTAADERARTGRVKYEGMLRRKNGELFLAEVSSVILDGGARSIVILRDVTERKRAEEELRQREEQLRTLGDQIPGGAIYQKLRLPDGSFKFLYMSAGIERIVGVPVEQVLADGMSLRRCVIEEDRPRLAFLEEQSARDISLFDCEYRMRSTSGKLRWIQARSTPRLLPDGSVLWDGVLFDITERKEVEVLLEKNRRTLVSALAAAEMGTWEYDLAANILKLGQRAQVLYGMSTSEWRHDDAGVAAVLHPDDIRPMWLAVARACDPKGDGRYEAEYRVRRPEGGWRMLNVWGLVVFEGSGDEKRAVAITGASRDVTREREAQEALRLSKERFQAVLETSLDAVYRRDLRTDNYDYLSPVIEQVLGISCEQMKTMPESAIVERVHPDDRVRFERTINESLEARKARVEYRFLGDDGRYRWVSDSFTVQVDGAGRPVFSCGTLRDISARKRDEELLKAAKVRAEDANRTKDQFLAALSHELRTPLTPILLGVHLLAERSDLPSDARADLAAIRRNVELEARLIDDLLDISRVMHGKISLTLQKLDLHTVLEHVASICLPMMNARSQHFDLVLKAARRTVSGDPARLEQVFWNLLSNACKFTPPEGRILLETSDDGSAVRIRVSDTGRGIDQGLAARMFSAFEQGQSGQFGGLGLGLAITKNIVELHHGEICVSSEGSGRGCTFTVALPLVEGAADVGQQPLLMHAERVKRSVLLVEDHADTRVVMRRALKVLGFEVFDASTVAQALQIADNTAYDVLLCDIGLPDGTGIDLLRALKVKPQLSIAITGYGMDDDVKRCRAAGFDKHLTKPVDLEVLTRALSLDGMKPDDKQGGASALGLYHRGAVLSS